MSAKGNMVIHSSDALELEFWFPCLHQIFNIIDVLKLLRLSWFSIECLSDGIRISYLTTYFYRWRVPVQKKSGCDEIMYEWFWNYQLTPPHLTQALEILGIYNSDIFIYIPYVFWLPTLPIPIKDRSKMFLTPECDEQKTYLLMTDEHNENLPSRTLNWWKCHNLHILSKLNPG